MKNILPKVGDFILEYNEDSEEYQVYRMFDSVIRKDNCIYLLETALDDYKAATKSDFEDEISDFIYDAPMLVLELNNKHVNISTHSLPYDLFRFNVTKNYYEIVFAKQQDSEILKNEFLELINKQLNTENFMEYIEDKIFEFKILYNENKYTFELL